MTYNEWRDELKNNLLCVSESERRRVLDYYAEAYADRRDAGFTEREIIDDFGAPYDAAQRILYDGFDERQSRDPLYQVEREEPLSDRELRREERERRREERHAERERKRNERDDYYEERRQSEQKAVANETPKKKEDHTWVFVLLCIIFAIPLFALIMTMVGVTVSLCVAPFGVLVQGIGTAVTGVIDLFSNLTSGLFSVGIGVIEIGLAVILIPLCIKLVKLMWYLFKKLFRWIKSLFSGKERA